MTRGESYSEEREDRIKEVICWKPESVRKYEETTESKINRKGRRYKQGLGKTKRSSKRSHGVKTHSGKEMEDKAEILVGQRMQ